MSAEVVAVRRLVTEKLKQIKAEVNKKKTITAKKCFEWLDELADVVLTYDSNTDPSIVQLSDKISMVNLKNPLLQPKLRMVRIPGEDDSIGPNGPNQEVNGSSNKMAATANVVEDNRSVVSVSSSSTRSGAKRDGVRYKGRIVGLESINGGDDDDEWENTSQTEKREPKGRKRKATQTAKSSAKKTKADSQRSGTLESTPSTSRGHVLGGSQDVESESDDANTRRQRLLRATEQRLNAVSGRPSSSQRSRRAPSDLPDMSGNRLRWQRD